MNFFRKNSKEADVQSRIKFRPNKHASPHLNEKAERSQLTDKTDLYAMINIHSV